MFFCPMIPPCVMAAVYSVEIPRHRPAASRLPSLTPSPSPSGPGAPTQHCTCGGELAKNSSCIAIRVAVHVDFSSHLIPRFRAAFFPAPWSAWPSSRQHFSSTRQIRTWSMHTVSLRSPHVASKERVHSTAQMRTDTCWREILPASEPRRHQSTNVEGAVSRQFRGDQGPQSAGGTAQLLASPEDCRGSHPATYPYPAQEP